MRLGLINSAWAQAGRDTAWGIARTRDIGFDCIDIFTDPLDITIKERRAIARACRDAGLPIVSLPCVALGLIDLNPSVRRFSFDRAASFLDLTHEYEAKNVLLVLGEYVWQREVIPPAEQWDWAVTQLRELGRRADELNVEIALELEPFHQSLLCNISEMARFLNDVDHPRVKANVDISHMHLAKEPATALRRLAGRVAHVHISDCDGIKHGDLPPGRGVVDFPPYLAELRDLAFDGVVSIELEYSPDPDHIEEWVREAYAATAKLLADAGLRS